MALLPRFQVLAVVLTVGAAACSKAAPSGETQPAQLASTGQAAVGVLPASDSSKLIADYTRLCAAETTPSQQCEILRSLVVAEVSTALEIMQHSKDQRNVETALAALD